jgi:hypothetical protein
VPPEGEAAAVLELDWAAADVAGSCCLAAPVGAALAVFSDSSGTAVIPTPKGAATPYAALLLVSTRGAEADLDLAPPDAKAVP